jgi:hypothetical protein
LIPSVKYSYTRRGDAATNTEAATGSAATGLIGFDGVLEALEALRPHLLDQLADGLESFAADCRKSCWSASLPPSRDLRA